MEMVSQLGKGVKVACRLSVRDAPSCRLYLVPSILSPLTNPQKYSNEKAPSPSEISELSSNLLHKAPKSNQSPTDASRNVSRYDRDELIALLISSQSSHTSHPKTWRCGRTCGRE